VVNIVYADDYRADSSIAPGQEDTLLLKELERHLHRMSDLYREVLLLVCVEGCSYEETAAVLELPIGTVRSRLARARDQLHERMTTGKDGPAEARRQSRQREKTTKVA
jgi:RNA polymerase sigma-70 factor (ECF subfamily)